LSFLIVAEPRDAGRGVGLGDDIGVVREGDDVAEILPHAADAVGDHDPAATLSSNTAQLK
jgi:hypothetical protein